MSNAKNVLNFLHQGNNTIPFGDKEYEVKRDAYLQVELFAKEEELIEKHKDSSAVEKAKARIDFLYEVFEIYVSKEFAEEVKKLKLSIDDLTFISEVLAKMSLDKTFDEAVEEIQNKERKNLEVQETVTTA
jgi:hypothetical protein